MNSDYVYSILEATRTTQVFLPRHLGVNVKLFVIFLFSKVLFRYLLMGGKSPKVDLCDIKNCVNCVAIFLGKLLMWTSYMTISNLKFIKVLKSIEKYSTRRLPFASHNMQPADTLSLQNQ